MSSQSPAKQCARHQTDQVSLPYSSTDIIPPSFYSRPGSPILVACRSDSSESSPATENDACRCTGKESAELCQPQAISIDMLPDDDLLEIFDFYVGIIQYGIDSRDRWQTLVHVCRRWRGVVFGSPRRLNLQLVCTTRTPTDTLQVWPALPLVIDDLKCSKEGLIAILECSELVPRITQISLWNVHSKDFSKAMEVPFPKLRHLRLRHWEDETEPVPLSDLFLGGSTPRLQVLDLFRIPFPGLPKLLSSATRLTYLDLSSIPHSGYISPEAMVACLSMSISLGTLFLRFQSPQSRPDWESRRPPPSKRTLLPALTRFRFKGVSEYLEDLVACIDAP